MASASTLPPPFLTGLHRPQFKSNFLPPFQVRRNPNPNPTNFSSKKFSISASSSSSDHSASSSWEREEQRWLREEQRWFREEQRWRSERESRIREIIALRLKIDALERGRSPPPLDAVDATISEVGTRPTLVEEAEVKKMIFEEVVRVSDEKKVVERKTLRIGSEGEEVRAMQDDINGTPTASVSKITEIKKTVIKETDDVEVEISAHRVFLLGENRWEEPSRLKVRDKPISGSKAVSVDIPCLNCRGEGQLLCTECDGSGVPNIEPQFLEWLDENAKCPYCKGLGYTTCDVCEGGSVSVQI